MQAAICCPQNRPLGPRLKPPFGQNLPMTITADHSNAKVNGSHAGHRPSWQFSKMHGAGNDFVLLDLRDGRAPPSPAQCQALAARYTGVGCDQILTIEPPRTAQALAAYRIFNADGSSAGQCGNGARCVAAWLRRAGAASTRFALDSPNGTHAVEALGDGHCQVSMGHPLWAPERIPLHGFNTVQSSYTLYVDQDTPLEAGVLSMGNPHAVIEVAAVASAPVEPWGSALQHSTYFPESVNVGFAEVVDAGHIQLRVFERGVGETLACGSGACAAVVSLIRRGRTQREVEVKMRGGSVQIAWPRDEDEVIMRGPAVFVFEGEWFL